jgi:uridine phosphorylase
MHERFKSAEQPKSTEGTQYHIQCKRDELAKYLLIPGEPERVHKISRFWEQAHDVSSHREFQSVTGKCKGVPISALSSGIGPGSIAIAVNEAASVGVNTFIRVGSSGAIPEEVKCGDIVISTSAVRLDGASQSYIIPEYPATAHHEVLFALIQAAEELNIKYHVGITATTSDFYTGQARPSVSGYVSHKSKGLIDVLENAKVLNFEMECATLFTLCNLFNLRGGSVCAVFANRTTNTFQPGAGEEQAIRVANEAISTLNKWDELKRKNRKKWFYPRLINK